MLGVAAGVRSFLGPVHGDVDKPLALVSSGRQAGGPSEEMWSDSWAQVVNGILSLLSSPHYVAWAGGNVI